MSNRNILDAMSMEELMIELRKRESPLLRDDKDAMEEPSPLGDIPSEEIISFVQDRQKVVYGTDDRKDLYNVTEPAIMESADSVVSLWRSGDVVDNGNGTSTLVTQNFGISRNLCQGEPFRNQPIGAFCTGFLIAPDIIATAGHCADHGNLHDIRFVFGYRMQNSSDAATIIDNSEIYSGTAILGRQLTNGGADWALVRLDRAVTNHAIVPIRRTGTIQNEQSLYVIGHPVGLPCKYAPGANVKDNGPASFFVANLDTYGGNSGSPVFNSTTHEVEGILVRGEKDFIIAGNCAVSMVCPDTGCRGEDCTRTTVFSSMMEDPLEGTFTIKQKSSNRYLDAHETGGFSAITRTQQSDETQRWVLRLIGKIYTIRQKSSGRYLDAHEQLNNDYSSVTRPAQNDDSQRWVLKHLPGAINTYTIQQLKNGRFLDAYEHHGADFSAVTRTAQNNDSQRWVVTHLGQNDYTIHQRVNGRYLDAYASQSSDYNVVTRRAQNNDTQRWILTDIGGVYTIQQKSSGRYLDAHESGHDHAAMTRVAENNNSQSWVLKHIGGETYTMQQLINGRFLDAYEAGNDHKAVTRLPQNNNTQKWLIQAG